MAYYNHILIVFFATLALLCSASDCGAAAPAKSAAKDFVVVIDAGHGEHDAGALGNFSNEKSINLGVALKLGRMLSARKGIKVIYTRNTDKFVTLQGRCDIANKAGGDLFVSIHTNSLDKKSPKRTTINGASVYTLGLQRSDENLAVAMRENSVMKLESDYSTTYSGFDPTSSESYIIFEMSQNKHMERSISAAHMVQRELVKAGRADRGVRQANFWVLFKTAMPAMLVELDFISNPSVEKYLASEKGQQELASAIFRGITNYVRSRHVLLADALPQSEVSSSAIDADTTKGEITVNGTKPDSTSDKKDNRQEQSAAHNDSKSEAKPTVFKIQILTAPRVLPDKDRKFKGLSPVEYYREGSVVKYTYGRYGSRKEAAPDLKTVRRLFPDAFIIATDGEKRIK